MKDIFQSLKIYILYTLVLGLIYPLVILGIAQITMPYQANGSLIIKDNRVIGSELIGQKFTHLEYFQSRPSAVDYNGMSSGGSNLGPSNVKLIDQVTSRIQQVRTENNLTKNIKIPADMVLTSASGLDPHISLENAMMQLPRISKLRGITNSEIHQLIRQNTDPTFVGIWGQPGINVLKLNLALDHMQEK